MWCTRSLAELKLKSRPQAQAHRRLRYVYFLHTCALAKDARSYTRLGGGGGAGPLPVRVGISSSCPSPTPDVLSSSVCLCISSICNVICGANAKKYDTQITSMSSAQRGLPPLVKSAKYNILVHFNQLNEGLRLTNAKKLSIYL